MTFEEFTKFVDAMKLKHPFWFEFQGDGPISQQRIDAIEAEKNILFPENYKKFISTYGPGDFAFTSIYSPDPLQNCSLWNDIKSYPEIPHDFIPFADNGCGDYLGFPVTEGHCEDRVLWADHEEGYILAESDYPTFLDYLLIVGLKAEE